MRSVFQIFRRDLRRLLRNPAAALVMAGVCLLPSFYAWFNIAANMDPYSNTQGIKGLLPTMTPAQTQRCCHSMQVTKS